jgi:hypothetical protein
MLFIDRISNVYKIEQVGSGWRTGSRISGMIGTLINYGNKKFYNVGSSGCTIKHLILVMHRFCIKVISLSEPVEVTDNGSKTVIYYRLFPFSTRYESEMFYSTGPWRQCYKTFYGRKL